MERRPMPETLDIGSCLPMLIRLSKSSLQFGKFLECGASVELRDGRFHLGEITVGDETSVTIRLTGPGSAHTHRPWPGGLPTLFSSGDFYTALRYEWISFLVSANRILALVKTPFARINATRQEIIAKYNDTFTNQTCESKNVWDGLYSTNKVMCGTYGLAGYEGTLQDSIIRLVWVPDGSWQCQKR